MKANEGKGSAWFGLLMRRLLFFLGVAMIAFGYYCELTGYRRDSLLQFAVIILGIASFATAYRWSCPRCGKNYCEKNDEASIWALWRETCVHCGVPEGEDPVQWREAAPADKKTAEGRAHESPEAQEAAKRRRQQAFLTLVLRDDPGAIGLKPDKEGWVEIDSLQAKAKRYGIDISTSDLERFLVDSCADDFESDRSGALVRFKKTPAARNERG